MTKVLSFAVIATTVFLNSNDVIAITTVDLSDCGPLIITCEDHDVTKCCQGECCSRLTQFQNGDPSAYIPVVGNAPTSTLLPEVGESCTARLPRGHQCFGDHTRCRFSDYDLNGHLLGTCCVLDNSVGCATNEDCCKFDGLCDNGKCVRGDSFTLSASAQVHEHVIQTNSEQNARIREVESAQSLPNIIPETNDRNAIKSNKPGYVIWVSLTVNMVIFVSILIAFLCLFNYWLYTHYVKSQKYKKTMPSAHGLMQRIKSDQIKQNDNEECSETSDDTGYEESDEEGYS